MAVCTGHGLKDPDIVMRGMEDVTVLPADPAAIEAGIFGQVEKP